jgi:hypothetical protein
VRQSAKGFPAFGPSAPAVDRSGKGWLPAELQCAVKTASCAASCAVRARDRDDFSDRRGCGAQYTRSDSSHADSVGRYTWVQPKQGMTSAKLVEIFRTVASRIRKLPQQTKPATPAPQPPTMACSRTELNRRPADGNGRRTVPFQGGCKSGRLLRGRQILTLAEGPQRSRTSSGS